MKTFNVTAKFRPTITIKGRVEPFLEDIVDPFGFLALEGGAGLILQEDGARILLEDAVISLTADSTLFTADGTTDTADQTFILNTTG